MRGEDENLDANYGPEDGSPPHAWGRSARRQIYLARRAVHPHMRGEDSKSTVILT